MFAEHDDRSRNGPRCCCGDALDEGTDLRISGKAFVEGADDYDKKIYREEDTHRGGAGAGDPRDEVTDESNGYHHRTGCNHRHGYGIKKLGFGQPMMLLDYASMKKWNNREAAAKHKQTRLQKEDEQGTCCTEHARDRLHEGKHGCLPFPGGEIGPRNHHQKSASQKQPNYLL